MKLFKGSAVVAVMAFAMLGFLMTSAHAGCGSEVNGWGGIAWGQDYETVKDDLILTHQYSTQMGEGENAVDAEICIYFMKGYEVPANFGIEQPHFIFLNGKFASSFIPITSEDGFMALAIAFTETCGEPDVQRRQGIGWEDEVTVIYMTLDGCIVGSPLGVIAAAEVMGKIIEDSQDL